MKNHKPRTFWLAAEPDMIVRCTKEPRFDEQGYVLASVDFQSAAGLRECTGISLKPGEYSKAHLVLVGDIKRTKP